MRPATDQAPSSALTLLQALTADRRHVFLAELPPLSVASALLERIRGHQQVTDSYLLQVAMTHRATLATFDRRLEAVAADASAVEILV